MDQLLQDISKFIKVAQYCGKHSFEFDWCNPHLAATIALLLALLAIPIVFFVWVWVRRRRRRIISDALIRAHLEAEARVADPQTMGRLRWDETKAGDASLTEEEMAAKIREGLKWRKIHGDKSGSPKLNSK